VNPFPCLRIALVGLLALAWLRAAVPVILDTDLGTDIDDTWALAQLLRSKELKPLLVLSDSGDTEYRAALVAKFLQAAGRTDIPVGVGHNFGPMPEDAMNQKPWLGTYRLADYPGRVHRDGIGALIETIMASPEPVTIIAIGAVPNLAEALRREPRIAQRCRFVGMHGSFRLGYDGAPGAVSEANVKGAPEALRVVLAAPWQDVLLTPLDTCGVVSLKGEDYHRIWSATSDPVLRAVIENYCVFAPRVSWMHCDWFPVASTTLFDCVAVYLGYSENLVRVETLRFDVDDQGFTRLSETGAFKARVATGWKDRAAFEHHLAERLLGRE